MEEIPGTNTRQAMWYKNYVVAKYHNSTKSNNINVLSRSY